VASTTQDVQFTATLDGENSSQEFILNVSEAEDAGVATTIPGGNGDVSLGGTDSGNVSLNSVSDNTPTSGDITINVSDDTTDGFDEEFTITATLTHDTSVLTRGDDDVTDVAFELSSNGNSDTVTFDVFAPDEEPEFDVNASDTNLVFQGQVVLADDSNITGGVDEGEAVTLRRGSPDDDNSFVRQNSANNQGEATFQTENLEADDYYIIDSDDNLIGEFEVTPQSFDGEFDTTEVDNGGTATTTTHTVDAPSPTATPLTTRPSPALSTVPTTMSPTTRRLSA
jgi:hypothetical protein